jgi:hypothetical protein
LRSKSNTDVLQRTNKVCVSAFLHFLRLFYMDISSNECKGEMAIG